MSELTIKEKETEIIQFVKNAFCINGAVELVTCTHIEFDSYIKCTDKKRGIFYVAWKPNKDNREKEEIEE